MFTSTERVAFYIGNYPVMKYGITMGAAIFASFVCLLGFRKRFYPEISEDILYDLSFWVILFGIIGARAWYVLLGFPYFLSNPNEILMINHGGITIHGALIGGIIAGFVFVKKNHLDFFKLADLYAMVVPIGQAIADGAISLIPRLLENLVICLGNYIFHLKTDLLNITITNIFTRHFYMNA